MDNREKEIANIVLQLYQKDGEKFKMDDVAKALKISKKTIYKDYGNKETLIILVVKKIFESIENKLIEIVNDDKYNTVEKLIKVTCIFPDIKDIDYNKAILIKKDFSKAYEMFVDYIDNNWLTCEKLFNQSIKEGYIKNIDFQIFKTIVLGITYQVLNSSDNDKEAMLNTCIEQIFYGFKI